MDSALVAIALIALLLRLYRLGDPSIWADELQRIVWSKGLEFTHVYGWLPSELAVRLPPNDLMSAIRILVDHNPPAYGTLLHGWMVIAGSASDFVLRLPSVLFGVVTVVAVYLAIREISDTVAARWGALLVALSPFHIFYAQEINHYTLGTALVATSFMLYFRRLRAASPWNGIGLCACVLGGLLTHYFTGVVFAFQALGLLMYRGRTPGLRQRLQWLWPYAAGLIGFLPYAVVLHRQLREMTDPAQAGHFGGLASFLEQLRALASSLWLSEAAPIVPVWYAAALGATVLVLTLAGAWRARDERGLAPLLLMTALGPTAAILALYWVAHVNSLLWPRYHLLFTPGLAIVLAIALPRRSLTAVPAGAALIAMGAIGLHALYFSFTKESWKQVAATIDARAGDRDTVIVYRSNLVYALARYLRREPRLFGLTPDATLKCATAMASTGDAVWLVSAWEETPDSTEAFLRVLRQRFRSEESIAVTPGRVGTRLFRFSQPSARWADDPCPTTAPG